MENVCRKKQKLSPLSILLEAGIIVEQAMQEKATKKWFSYYCHGSRGHCAYGVWDNPDSESWRTLQDTIQNKFNEEDTGVLCLPIVGA